MRTRDYVELGGTVVVAAVALVMGILYLQQVRMSSEATGTNLVDDWREKNEIGIRRGPSDADLVITEFMDFECPFCASLVPTVDSILDKYPERVAQVFQHFPLSQHEHATPAAIAAECAYQQDHFWEMYDAIYENQDQLGERDWEYYADEAGVPNEDAFEECLALPVDSFPRIEEGIALGERNDVRGTPTTWINGQVVRPTLNRVEELLEEESGR